MRGTPLHFRTRIPLFYAMIAFLLPFYFVKPYLCDSSIIVQNIICHIGILLSDRPLQDFIRSDRFSIYKEFRPIRIRALHKICQRFFTVPCVFSVILQENLLLSLPSTKSFRDIYSAKYSLIRENKCLQQYENKTWMWKISVELPMIKHANACKTSLEIYVRNITSVIWYTIISIPLYTERPQNIKCELFVFESAFYSEMWYNKYKYKDETERYVPNKKSIRTTKIKKIIKNQNEYCLPPPSHRVPKAFTSAL